MARKRTFDHGRRYVRPDHNGFDRLTGSYSITTLDDTGTPYGQHLRHRHTPQDPGPSRVNVAPKRTFDHDRPPLEVEGIIRRAAILVYAIGAVIALALLVGVFHHDGTQPPADSGTPANVTTIGGPR